jgi:DnaJ-domain-containing protein 1
MIYAAISLALIVLIITFPLYSGIIKMRINELWGNGLTAKGDEQVNVMPVSIRWSNKNMQIAYLYLAGWILRKNASDSKDKIQFIKSYFIREFGEFHSENQAELVNAMKLNTNIRSVSNWILHYLKDGSERTKIIDFLFEIAKVDGQIIDREFVAIVRLAELIGVRASYIEKKLKEFNDQKFRTYNESRIFDRAGERRTKALLVLQLAEGFTENQLKRAYRKMAKRYHPDAQKSQGVEDKRMNNEKFLQIQEAYEYLSGSK